MSRVDFIASLVLVGVGFGVGSLLLGPNDSAPPIEIEFGDQLVAFESLRTAGC